MPNGFVVLLFLCLLLAEMGDGPGGLVKNDINHLMHQQCSVVLSPLRMNLIVGNENAGLCAPNVPLIAVEIDSSSMSFFLLFLWKTVIWEYQNGFRQTSVSAQHLFYNSFCNKKFYD